MDLSRQDELLLRHLHASTAMTLGVMAPMHLGKIRVEKVGFGRIPVVEIQVFFKGEIAGAIPAIRQFVFHELETSGISNDAVLFTPRVERRARRRKFLDTNESSPTLGKHKIGGEFLVRFEIKPECVALFEWGHFGHGKIPGAAP